MRLLRIDGSVDRFSLNFEEFLGEERPPYAILSHTWGEEEVSYKEFLKRHGSLKRRGAGPGYDKILGCARQALKDRLNYIWVDTCCIDKRSSAELTEAINSMFKWYEESSVCYVYLTDVPQKPWPESRYFTRGWTLQELLAPKDVRFYDLEWNYLLNKKSKGRALTKVTGIPEDTLYDSSLRYSWTISDRMSWAARRETTRIEDAAYCLLGLFDVNLPLLYGEGRKSFLRLQEAIMQKSNDSSILAWKSPGNLRGFCGQPLAVSPRAFSWSCYRYSVRGPLYNKCTVSKLGIHIETTLFPVSGQEHVYKAVVNGVSGESRTQDGEPDQDGQCPAILVLDITELGWQGSQDRHCIRIDESFLDTCPYVNDPSSAEEVLLVSTDPVLKPSIVWCAGDSVATLNPSIEQAAAQSNAFETNKDDIERLMQTYEHTDLNGSRFVVSQIKTPFSSGTYLICEHQGIYYIVVAGRHRYHRPWIRIFPLRMQPATLMAQWSSANSFDGYHENLNLKAMVRLEVRHGQLYYQLSIIPVEADWATASLKRVSKIREEQLLRLTEDGTSLTGRTLLMR